MTPSTTILAFDLGLSWALLAQGIVVGVVSSITYLLISYSVRPRMHICKGIVDACSSSGPQYKFKVINLGVFSMVDVELALEIVTTEVIDGNQSVTIHALKLTRDTLTLIPPIRPKFMSQSRSYACRLRTHEDLASRWTSPQQHLRLMVKAKHPLTGFQRLTVRNFYYTHQRPVRGDFKQGWRWGMIVDNGSKGN